MSRGCIFAGLLFFVFCAAGAAADSMTVEMENKAAVIRGEKEVVEEVRVKIEALSAGDTGAPGEKEVREILRGYADGVYVEIFEKPELSGVTGLKKTQLSIREAVCRGMLPPIEGLAGESAAAVLKAFGFSVFGTTDFNDMPEGRKIGEILLAGSLVAVLSGTGPLDEIVIYRK